MSKRHIKDIIVLGLFVIGVNLIIVVPMYYWWNHSSFTQMQILQACWKSYLTGLLSLGLGVYLMEDDRPTFRGFRKSKNSV